MKASKRTRTPDDAKTNGVHYTPPDLARFLAAQTWRAVGAFDNSEFRNSAIDEIHVLDPACGDGGLLLAFSQTAPSEVRRRLVLTGYERDAKALEKAAIKLSGAGVAQVVLREQDFLSVAGVASPRSARRRLLEGEPAPAEQFRVVIANPPYVRTQLLGAAKAQRLAERFQLTGRVDLYHAFVAAMANVLQPGGMLGLLTSNRFLTVQSGAALRRLLRTQFTLDAIFDLGDTKLFNAAVLPAVVIAAKQQATKADCVFDRIYEQRGVGDDTVPDFACPSVLDALQERKAEGLVKTLKGLYRLERGVLSVAEDEGWSLSTPAVDAWLRSVSDRRECVFSDVGKVRVGVKTTADAVFIKDDWESLPSNQQPEAALLRPLLTHFEAQRWFVGGDRKAKRLLYPHTVESGRKVAVDLAAHPRAAAYLKSHEKRLRSRKYVLEAGRQWYEIWVPQHPDDWKKPKIVYPDISEFPRFFLDTTGALVNGDCYWITTNEGVAPEWLLMMLAVANSTFITRYYDAVHHNKLYSGRRRFMTQYVNGFPLPSLKSKIGRKIVKLVARLVEDGKTTPATEDQIDRLVWESFGLRRDPVAPK